ncbi:MAG: hypothetical protein R3D88_04155 [Alphaproteobacteria bacterium]|nr:hypothetical protein [Alphaproteobacteria bacterium]
MENILEKILKRKIISKIIKIDCRSEVTLQGEGIRIEGERSPNRFGTIVLIKIFIGKYSFILCCSYVKVGNDLHPTNTTPFPFFVTP